MATSQRASKQARARQRLRRHIARSVDAPVSLLPVFNLLFKDMPSLGSSPRRVVSMLQRAGIGPRSRVLDLACGKGTIAISATRHLECQVVGVDACESFIKEAAAAATRAAITDRVTFVQDDVRAFARRAARAKEPFDAALMIGLFGIEEAAPLLRRLVRARGIYMIDDVVRDDRHTSADPDLDLLTIPTRNECERLIQSLGDRVEDVHIQTPARARAMNDALYAKLVSNARAIAKRRPTLRPALKTFLRNQHDANQILAGPLRPVIWLIRRR